MSYENLRSTKLLATRCAVCARPLRDAVSVELGIGPDCRAKHGYNEAINDQNRIEANRLIYLIADVQTGIPAADACRALEALGFARLASVIATRLFSVRIVRAGATLQVFAPYTEAGVQAFRSVPGRRWDAEIKANTFPAGSKGALWSALKRAFPGYSALGPEGQIIPIPA